MSARGAVSPHACAAPPTALASMPHSAAGSSSSSPANSRRSSLHVESSLAMARGSVAARKPSRDRRQMAPGSRHNTVTGSVAVVTRAMSQNRSPEA
eukprot:scaffold7371_cov121-Isochrysis_galbana.AAC.1